MPVLNANIRAFGLSWWLRLPCLLMQKMQEMWVGFLGWEEPLEKEMATHFSILAGKSHGQRSLEYYSPLGHKRVGYDLATEQ